MAIMAAHRVPYAATLSLAHREDFLRKLAVAKPPVASASSSCSRPAPPAGSPSRGHGGARAPGGRHRHVPLYEVFNGRRYRIDARPDGTPLEEYFARQQRFSSSALDVARLRDDITDQWRGWKSLAAEFPTDDTVAEPHPAHCWLRLLVEDKPSVLARVARQVARRKVNIETVVVRSLPIAPTPT